MGKNEYKDSLIEVLRNADDLPIQNIAVDDENDIITIYLEDGEKFIILVDNVYKKMKDRDARL
jgi:hypothetical protein